MLFIKNKKTISPVVALALLIVVAVVSVVSFQTWFSTYSSGIFTNTETQSSNSVQNTGIDSVIGNRFYFKNSGLTSITITAIKVDGVDCNKNFIVVPGDIADININNCLANVNISNPEVVAYSEDKLYSKYIYKKQSFSLLPPADEIWNLSYDGGNNDYVYGIAVDSSGNVYVTGDSNFDFYTIKYDSSRNKIWNVSYDSGNVDSGQGVAVDNSGNVYVTGDSNFDFYTIKYDSSGNEIWNVSYDGGNSDTGQGVAVDNSGNVYVTGQSNNDYYTIKYEQS